MVTFQNEVRPALQAAFAIVALIGLYALVGQIDYAVTVGAASERAQREFVLRCRPARVDPAAERDRPRGPRLFRAAHPTTADEQGPVVVLRCMVIKEE